MTTPKYKDINTIKQEFNMTRKPQKRLMERLESCIPKHTSIEKEYLLEEGTNHSPSVRSILIRKSDNQNEQIIDKKNVGLDDPRTENFDTLIESYGAP